MIIQQIPLTQVPNQRLTTSINGNTFNLTVTTKSINTKKLRGENADVNENTMYSTFTSIALGDTPIIQNTISLHATYLNPYESAINGYLFFYADDGDVADGDDHIIYTRFGKDVFLYYSDTDVLKINYAVWLKENQPALSQRFIYNGY